MTGRRPTIARLERAGKALEDAVLVIMLTGMIALAAGQIVLRNFFDIGFFWTDEMLRLLVLWLAVAGAVAASRKNRHISIAVLDRFLPPAAKAVVDIMLHLFTAAICGLFTWHSLAFVRTSHEFGDVLLGSVPAWIPQAVLPLGFGLITYRYALFALRGVFRFPQASEPA